MRCLLAAGRFQEPSQQAALPCLLQVRPARLGPADDVAAGHWCVPRHGGSAFAPGGRGGSRLAPLTSTFPKRFLAARSEQSARGRRRVHASPLNAVWAWTRGGPTLQSLGSKEERPKGTNGSAVESLLRFFPCSRKPNGPGSPDPRTPRTRGVTRPRLLTSPCPARVKQRSEASIYPELERELRRLPVT
nr:unnamed protein product [Digitaria exilis]